MCPLAEQIRSLEIIYTTTSQEYYYFKKISPNKKNEEKGEAKTGRIL